MSGSFDENIISSMREDYKRSILSRDDLNINPFNQFNVWFAEAVAAKLIEPNAMILGTTFNSRPRSRTVLLKGIDDYGFLFFTNYLSNKSSDISSQSYVSLLFPWYQLERQVMILGHAQKIDKSESRKYFYSRPIESQIGAWASPQSEVVSSREFLENKLEN